MLHAAQAAPAPPPAASAASEEDQVIKSLAKLQQPLQDMLDVVEAQVSLATALPKVPHGRGMGPGLAPYVPIPFLNPPPSVHWW
jgi:hypothetical protein